MAAREPFTSRWVPLPEHCRLLEDADVLPDGFRAAGVAAGIKPSGGTDVGPAGLRRAGRRRARRASRAPGRPPRPCC